MRFIKIITVVFFFAAILACASPKEKAYKSQEAVNRERLELAVNRERLELIDQYKSCMKKAGQDKEKQAGCEQYLKAADALK